MAGSEAGASTEILPIQKNEQFQEIFGKLEQIEEMLRGNNEIESTDDIGRYQAEISATQRILLGPSVRRSVVEDLIMRGLKVLGEKFADHAIGIVAGLLISLIAAYFGIPLPS